jgi:hypothetical protein
MTQLDKLEIGEVSELTTGKKEDFRVKVEEKDLSLQDLKALKEAEKSGQNRKKVLKFLDRQMDTKNIANHLDTAEEDTAEIESLVAEIEKIEDIESFEEESIDIDQDDLIDLVGGTVDEMKEFVGEEPLTGEQLKDVLDAEQRVKNRKTAKRFLERELEKKNVEEDVSETKEDLEKVKEDLEELKEDKNIEDGEVEDTEEAEEQESDEEIETQQESEEDAEEAENAEEQEGDNGSAAKEGEETGGDQEEQRDGDPDFSKKKDIADELDLSMTDEELESISLDELESLREEKMHREHLIDHLKDEGMGEEKLRNSSTADLEKIAESMEDSSDSQEEHEEMREEAEEDLEMLMGAVKNKEEDEKEEDDGKNAKEKLEDFKESIQQKLQRSGSNEESEEGINTERVQEILDEYRELDDEEAAVKTAHIMKGYLEQELGVEREMTYKELADKMPTEEHDEVERLADFFLKMHREQYTGRIAIDNSNEVIDTCEEVIKNLS